MALSISQILAASFSDVVNEKRKPSDQWSENAAMRALKAEGFIETVPGGPLFEATLDYRRNQGAQFLATDLESVSSNKTDVLTAAQFDPAELSVPIVWSRGDDAKNPTVNQKVSLVKSLIENALNSHDDLIEEAVFAVATEAFLGLQTICPNSGQGTVGGIDASTELFWRNYAGTFAANYSDITAKITLAWTTITRGSGSTMAPTLLITDAATHAGFEGTQQSLNQYVNTQEAKFGFKKLAVKTAGMIYSQYAPASIYFLSPKAFQIRVVKGAFRDMGEEQPLPLQNGFVRKIYSMLQSVTNNKSRLGVIYSA